MFGFSKGRLPVDSQELEWLMASAKWLIEALPGASQMWTRPLILPTTDFFPDTRLKGHARAQELFDLIRRHTDMADWECVLKAGQAPRPTNLGSGLTHSFESNSAAGTFQQAIDPATGRVIALIHYDPRLIDDPPSLVATFAHELAHAQLHTISDEPPGGPELEELVTDATAVFMGFGVFLANSAKSFSAFQSFDSSGWESRRQGYLSEQMLVTALALSELLAGRDPMAAHRWLKPYLADDLKQASAYFAKRHPDVRRDVMQIDLADYGI